MSHQLCDATFVLLSQFLQQMKFPQHFDPQFLHWKYNKQQTLWKPMFSKNVAPTY